VREAHLPGGGHDPQEIGVDRRLAAGELHRRGRVRVHLPQPAAGDRDLVFRIYRQSCDNLGFRLVGGNHITELEKLSA